MKKYIFLAVLVFVGVVAWRIGERLSSDAISMGLGVLFGVLAGVPTAILVMAGSRRREQAEYDRGRGGSRQMQPHYPQFAPQPPVIVLTGGAMPAQQPGVGAHYGQYGPPPNGQWQQQPSERRFKIVGEKEEWIDEW